MNILGADLVPLQEPECILFRSLPLNDQVELIDVPMDQICESPSFLQGDSQL